MAVSKNKAYQDLITLKSTVATTTALIAQLQTYAQASKTPPNADRVNALDLAHDAASLIRAHSTKISLLIINRPFTPSAVTGILRELIAGPLPGLASGLELCHAGRYTKVMTAEMQYRAGRVFIELDALVKTIPLNGEILTEDQKNGTGEAEGKGSLALTGTLWDACDAVLNLKDLGVAGLLIMKAEEYRDLLKDALEELQEWAGEESDEEGGAGDESQDEAQASVDNIFGSQRHIPPDDPENIRPKLDSFLKRLRLLILLFQAVVKRRFKTLPYLPHSDLSLELKVKSNEESGIIVCLDEVIAIMKKIPDITDELASAFYELDVEEIDKRMEECRNTGCEATELLIKNWEGEKDEFSTWVGPPYSCPKTRLLLT